MKNIYLISSISYHLINDKIKSIAENNSNITYFSLNENTIYDVIDDASYFGLFNESRIIVVKNVKYFGGKFNYEEESNALFNFLSHLDSSTIMIFICDSILKSKDLTKKVLNLNTEIDDTTNINDENILEYLINYTKEHNIKIDNKVLKLILSNTMNNIDIAIEEIEKLSNISSDITEDIVRTYGINIEEVDTFEFSNAVISKNISKSFELLDKLLDTTDVYNLVGVLASSMTNMYMVRDAVDNGLDDTEIAKALGYANPNRVYVMKKNSRIYTKDELKEIIISLADLDLKIKSGYNPKYELKKFLLDL